MYLMPYKAAIAQKWPKTGLYNGQVCPSQLSPPSTLRSARSHLDNGLKIVVQEVHTAPLVSVWCWYRVGSRDEGPGRTGVSHWVEHMNFKGTTNIPREEMKGIVERFGGMWNGYTWIDQTTYLETAGRDALDQMLFLESERMANGLYEPAECESERTVIISELQGGENDPDQLLDTEVTATAFRAHPYRASDDRLARRSQVHDARRSLRPLPALLHPEQRDPRRRRGRRCGRRAAACGEVFRRHRSGAGARADSHRGAAAARRTAGPRRARRDDGLRQDRVSRAGGLASRTFSRCSSSTRC